MTVSKTAGDDSVLRVLEDFRVAGWSANHMVGPRAQVECGECGAVVGADAIRVGAQHRVEGASDPDDMQIVLGFPCPSCGAKGAVVLGYGPTGSEDDLDFMAGITLADPDHPVADPVSDEAVD